MGASNRKVPKAPASGGAGWLPSLDERPGVTRLLGVGTLCALLRRDARIDRARTRDTPRVRGISDDRKRNR